MAVVVSIDEKLISHTVVQDGVTVLKVVENTQDGAVVVVRGQGSQADVLQRDLLALICSFEVFDFQLQIQHLIG